MKPRSRTWLLVLVVVCFALLLMAWLLSVKLNRSGNSASTLPEPITAELVSRGAYLARAGDCVACHTAQGGKAFAGGLGIESPIGTIYATNITPDADSGIGHWSYGDFERAVRRGIRHDGSALYPAMPFPSYARMSDQDTLALYAYFMKGVTAVAQPNQRNDIPWPLSIRWPLAYWRAMFAPLPGAGKVKPAQMPEVLDPRIVRGAYLVQSLGHCGSCHTPRALTLQEKGLDEQSPEYLTGTLLNGWAVPPIRGIAHWSQQQVVDYLGAGRNDVASVAGEMTGVVANSTSHLSDEDLNAMAAYLKFLPASVPTPMHAQHPDATARKLAAAIDLSRGERLYLDNCAACHFVKGEGAPGVFPKLDGASVINAENPGALLHIILAGAETPSTARAPSVLPMPGFAYRMDDAEVAALATFVRQAWSNQARAVSDTQVRDIRK